MKFRTHVVYMFFGPFNRSQPLLEGCHLTYVFPLHSVYMCVCVYAGAARP